MDVQQPCFQTRSHSEVRGSGLEHVNLGTQFNLEQTPRPSPVPGGSGVVAGVMVSLCVPGDPPASEAASCVLSPLCRGSARPREVFTDICCETPPF